MSKFKLKKPGEGIRERKPSKYGDGGRSPGGAARTINLKKPSLPSKDDDLPSPGGHPKHLADKAKKSGKALPSSNPFERLQALQKKGESAVAVSPVSNGVVSDDYLDEMLERKPEVLRSTRTRGERKELLTSMQKRLPILRSDIEDEEEPKPEADEEAPTNGGENNETSLVVDGVERSDLAMKAQRRSKRTEYSLAQQEDMAGIMGMPGVVCDHCPAAENCPEFETNATCAYDEFFGGLSTRDSTNLLPILESFADMQAVRARRAVFLEARVTGGQIDPNVSRQIEVAAGAAERVARLKGSMEMGVKRSISIVSQETGAGGGMLSKLMEGLASRPAREDRDEEMLVVEHNVTTIDTTPEQEPRPADVRGGSQGEAEPYADPYDGTTAGAPAAGPRAEGAGEISVTLTEELVGTGVLKPT